MFGVHAVDVRGFLFRAFLLVVLSGSAVAQSTIEGSPGMGRAKFLYHEAHELGETNVLTRSHVDQYGVRKYGAGKPMERYATDEKGRMIKSQLLNAADRDNGSVWRSVMGRNEAGRNRDGVGEYFGNGSDFAVNPITVVNRLGTRQDYAQLIARAVKLDNGASYPNGISDYDGKYTNEIKAAFGTGRIRWVVDNSSGND